MDDNELLLRAARGDESAFELIVHRHTGTVWRLARSLLSDDGSAEEAVQDTFLRAHRALESFRADATVRTWLLAIAHHVCVDRLRLRRLPTVPLDLVALHRADHREADHDLRLALRAAVDRLDAVEREAFVLVDLLGHSREEAARICGVPASTMRSRVARARSQLMTVLDDRPVEAASR